MCVPFSGEFVGDGVNNQGGHSGEHDGGGDDGYVGQSVEEEAGGVVLAGGFCSALSLEVMSALAQVALMSMEGEPREVKEAIRPLWLWLYSEKA